MKQERFDEFIDKILFHVDEARKALNLCHTSLANVKKPDQMIPFAKAYAKSSTPLISIAEVIFQLNEELQDENGETIKWPEE